MYSGVLTNVPAFEQPATVSWLRYLLVVKGCGGGGVPRAGCCAAAPTTAVTTSTANPTTCFTVFTGGLLSVFAMGATIPGPRGSSVTAASAWRIGGETGFKTCRRVH